MLASFGVLNMFDSRGTTPVFYDQHVLLNDDKSPSCLENFDVRISHPAFYGFQIKAKKETKKIEEQEQAIDVRRATEVGYYELNYVKHEMNE